MQPFYFNNRLNPHPAVIPTGSLALDMATGAGGYIRGTTVEIAGEASSGKTLLATEAAIGAQMMAGLAYIVDTEHTFNRSFAALLGADIEHFICNQPKDGIEALKIFRDLATRGLFDVAVLDTVAALAPQCDTIGDSPSRDIAYMELNSELIHTVREVKRQARNTVAIYTNQLREGKRFTYSPGDELLKQEADIVIMLSRKGDICRDGRVIGDRLSANVLRNAVGSCAVAEFDYIYGRGISVVSELFDLGVIFGLIRLVEGYYTFGTILGRTKTEAMATLSSNISYMTDILRRLSFKLRAGQQLTTTSWNRLNEMLRK